MKTVLALLLISAASSAYAEGAPAVNENTGDLGYVYAFDLPKARGRYQPTLALVYSSANNRDLGYGHGWTLTSTYLERDVRTVPGKETLWLVEGAKRTLLVATSGSVFRPEVEDAFLEVTAVDPYSSSRPVYAARDANDTRFTFDRPHGSRVYLTRVEDLDGNVVSFRFARGTDVSLEDPVEVAYNLRPGTTSGFATVVRLDYGTGLDTTGAPVPAPSAPVAAGGPVFSEIGDVIDSFVRRTSRLNRVRILGAVGDPRERSIRGYDIRYTPASTAAGGYSSIAEITQLGLDLAPSRALPSTRFDYLGAASFGTAVEGAATLQPAPDPCWGFALVDVDADGRPDLRCSAEGELRWVRNVTPIGSDTLAFAPTASVVPLPAPPEGTGGWGLDDFNGDGVLDLVRWFRTSSDRTVHRIVIGRLEAGGPRFDASPIDLDITDVTTWDSLYRQAYAPTADFNGDGVKDFARLLDTSCGAGTLPACQWEYGYSDLVPGGVSRVVKQPGTLPRFPGAEWHKDRYPAYGTTGSQDAFYGFDLNGDGLPDAIQNEATLRPYGNTLSDRGYHRFATGVWYAALNAGRADPFAMGRVSKFAARLEGVGDSPDLIVQSNVNGGICGNYYSEDFYRVYAELVDLNGDGRPDFYRQGDAGPTVRWNEGGTFSEPVAVTGPEWARLAPETSGFADWTSFSSCMNDRAFFDCCSAELPSGRAGSFVDMNGDGIPDYRWSEFQGQRDRAVPTSISRGTLVGASGEALPIGRPMLLTRVVTPDRATLDVTYVPSTTFGGLRDGLRPVVTKLEVSGPYVAKGTTHYWYASPVVSREWFKPTQSRERGFARSWWQDETTGIVTSTWWATWSRPLAGKPWLVSTGKAPLGTPASVGAPGVPPDSFPLVTRVTYEYGLKSLSDDLGTGCLGVQTEEPAATSYPLRVLPVSARTDMHFGADTKSAWIERRVECVDVDANGSARKATASSGIGSAAGPKLVTRQVHTDTTSCPGVPQTLTVKRETDAGLLLAEETRTYDAGCRLTASWSPAPGGDTNKSTMTYDGPFRQQDTVTSGGVTKRTVYETALGLYVTEERTEDSVAALSTVFTTDDATGLRLSAAGPRASMGETVSTAAVITRYYVYDAFGRQVAVAKVPPRPSAASGTVPATDLIQAAVEATEYADEANPRAVTTYRFAVPSTFAPLAFGGRGTGAPFDSADTMKATAYLDALGRTIQVRERLGGALAANHVAKLAAGHVLSGVRVSKAILLDGAGRERASAEPFFAAGMEFVDYSATPFPGIRATVTTYDDEVAGYTRPRGAPWCVSQEYVGNRIPGKASDCTSSSRHDGSFRLATERRAVFRTVSARGRFGGQFVATEVIPPDQNEPGGSRTPKVTLAGPAGEELGGVDGDGNYVWIERDELGREIASWRESGSGTLKTPEPISRTSYTLAGQVFETWDGNFDGVVRRTSYDEAGRVSFVYLDAAHTNEGIEYLYEAGGLGRVTRVSAVAADGTATLVAQNSYDAPYNSADAGFSYVTGKLSWSYNGETTIAYGYDDAGRVSRRDQYFAKLDGARRFTVSSDYGADGRVLESRVVDGLDRSKTYRYGVEYDSAGHPVALAGNYIEVTADNVWVRDVTARVRVYEAYRFATNANGAYDALGRVPVMKADGGQVVSARVYDPYSGALRGECKRFGTEAACEADPAKSAPLLDAVNDIFRTDRVAAEYQGHKIKSYTDSGTATSYVHTYLPSGRLQEIAATPTGAVGALTQDWRETYAFNGVGNIQTVSLVKDQTAGNARPDVTGTETYEPESPSSGVVLDRVAQVKSTRTQAASSTSYAYDLLGHLVSVTRSSGVNETLAYAPGGELLSRKLSDRFVFYVGEYATITARNCGATCDPQTSTVEVDAHVIFAGTRIASAKASRTLFYYRTRLGTVIATSLAGGVRGAGYRYSPYGEVELAVNETEETRSELGYTNALRLSGTLLHLKARVYDTKARVFIQPDVVDRLRYAYVWGDPANLADPTGLLPVDQASFFSDLALGAGPKQQSPAENTKGSEPAGGEQAQQTTPTSPVEKERQEDGISLQCVATGAQGAAIATGAQWVHDGAVRASYSERVTGLDPSASQARTDAKVASREQLSPAGRVISEAKHPIDKPPRAGGRANVSNPSVNTLAEGAGKAGKVLIVVGVGVTAYNVARAPEGERPRVVAQEAGGWVGSLSFGAAGGWAGAKLGAGIGALGGPPGTFAGAVVGAVVGSVGGGVVGAYAGHEAADNLFDATMRQP